MQTIQKQTMAYTENIIKKGTVPGKETKGKETSNIGIVSVGAETEKQKCT